MSIKKVDQQALFNYTLKDLPQGYKFSPATLTLWHKTGYLSFDPNKKNEFTETEFHEFRFISTLFKSELSLISIDKLLTKLKKPYAYDISKIFYNWIKKEWDYLPQNNNPDIYELIENMYRNKEIKILRELRKKLDELLKESNGGDAKLKQKSSGKRNNQ